MISWIKGEKIDTWENGSRSGITIACAGIGYDVQVLSRNLSLINNPKESLLWVHQVQKEDGSFLIGFLDKKDRDFFRKLISVNGIGPQLAMSLLEKNQANELILAIIKKEISQLTACSGIGKRTAERLIIELQNKLSHLIQTKPINTIEKNQTQINNLNIELIKEVKSALINLEYKDSEIDKAFQELQLNYQFRATDDAEQKRLSENHDFESLLRETLHIINK